MVTISMFVPLSFAFGKNLKFHQRSYGMSDKDFMHIMKSRWKFFNRYCTPFGHLVVRWHMWNQLKIIISSIVVWKEKIWFWWWHSSSDDRWTIWTSIYFEMICVTENWFPLRWPNNHPYTAGQYFTILLHYFYSQWQSIHLWLEYFPIDPIKWEYSQ